MKKNSRLTFALILALSTPVVMAGVLDPDCNAEKMAKSAAMKATIGIGGRCTPAKAAKDMSRNAVGIKKKHKKNDDGLAKKAKKKAFD